MEQNRRAESQVALIRWIGLAVAALMLSDGVPLRLLIGGVAGVAASNAAGTFPAAPPAPHARVGRQIGAPPLPRAAPGPLGGWGTETGRLGWGGGCLGYLGGGSWGRGGGRRPFPALRGGGPGGGFRPQGAPPYRLGDAGQPGRLY